MEEHRPRTGWQDGGEIVPGERIGNFLLGRRCSELIPAGGATIAEYSMRFDVRIELEKDVLVDLSTHSSKFATAEGIRAGSEFADAVAAWGEPAERRALEGGQMFDFKAAWPERGVDCVVKDGKILHLGVFLPQ